MRGGSSAGGRAARLAVSGPGGERFGAMKGEEAAGAGVGVFEAARSRFRRRWIRRGRGGGAELRVRRGDPGQLLLRLWLDAAEGNAFGLGFDDAHGLAVDKEQIVSVAAAGKFAHGDAAPRTEIPVPAVLHQPAGGGEQVIDLRSGEFFGCWHSCGFPLA